MQRSFNRATALKGRRPSFGNRRPSFPTRGNFSRGVHIDPTRFINRAVEDSKVEEYVAKHKFQDFNIDQRIKQNVAAKGYLSPTPIQDQAIEHVLKGVDVVGIANTGTGKTAAFLIPLINKVLLNPQENILIIVPTRELGVQINEEFNEFARFLRVYSVCCVGGASIGRQVADLRRRFNFIIGTPGRIKDLMERGLINLSKFNTVVLDEADRLLDMGFIVDTRFMIGRMPAKHQTLFFSATFSREVQSLIREFLKDPVTISVKTRDTAKSVDQDIIRVKPGSNKLEMLHDLLNKPEFDKVLVFGRTKHGVERLYRDLEHRGFKAESIHGNKNHNRRQKVLEMFKGGRIQVLVATDVAARGLDIQGVSHVINFDIPSTYEDYVHRIGRTGRADKKGVALTFVD